MELQEGELRKVLRVPCDWVPGTLGPCSLSVDHQCLSGTHLRETVVSSLIKAFRHSAYYEDGGALSALHVHSGAWTPNMFVSAFMCLFQVSGKIKLVLGKKRVSHDCLKRQLLFPSLLIKKSFLYPSLAFWRCYNFINTIESTNPNLSYTLTSSFLQCHVDLPVSTLLTDTRDLGYCFSLPSCPSVPKSLGLSPFCLHLC